MQISPWMEGVTERAPVLEGDLDVDVAVVGAGFTGLSTAIALRERGASVAILEREIAGFGASGRNAGHLTPWIGKDPPTLKLLFGAERARALLALVATAIQHVERTIEKHAIDCAYEPVGNVMAVVHPKQNGMLDKTAKAAADLGVDVEMLEPAEMRRRGLPAGFIRGGLVRPGGILHPGRYVRGLRRVALAAGARLFEGTAVERIEEGAPATVHTPRGRVRAGTVVLGTNAFTCDLGYLRNRVARLHVYLFRTAPLTPAQLQAVGWAGREGLYTAHEMLESYRLTDDNRIVGGGKTVRYGYGNRWLEDDAGTYAFVEGAFRDRFPELHDVPVTDHWGGPIGCALDFLPAVGRTGKGQSLCYSVGYAGHGVAMASYAGTMIADLLSGEAGPGRALWGRRGVPLPPEPFRWLIVNALTGLFGAIDARVDRVAKPHPLEVDSTLFREPPDGTSNL